MPWIAGVCPLIKGYRDSADSSSTRSKRHISDLSQVLRVARLCLLVWAALSVSTLSTRAQLDDTISVPFPGVGQDYIQNLNETVNLENGALGICIRITAPTPKESGANLTGNSLSCVQ